jgi:hypothetical protein
MIYPTAPLPLNVARCPSTRQKPCAQADTCARALAPMQGRDTYDFSAGTRDHKGACLSFIAVQRLGPSAPQPKVHEAPEGLR